MTPWRHRMDYEHITAVAFILAGLLLAAMLFVSL